MSTTTRVAAELQQAGENLRAHGLEVVAGEIEHEVVRITHESALGVSHGVSARSLVAAAVSRTVCEEWPQICCEHECCEQIRRFWNRLEVVRA